MAKLRWRAWIVLSALITVSCGDGLYQKAPEGITSSRSTALLYVGHAESIRFTGKGLKGASFSVTPSLPAGLSLDPDLPGITGTPSSAGVLTEYSVHVKSDFGESDFTFSMKVNLSSPTPTNLRDIFTGGASSPVILGHIGEAILFSAESNAEGRELWKTDGTVGGTVLVKDIDSGVGLSSSPFAVKQAQNSDTFTDLIFFGAETAAGGVELYKTDGTTGGTVMTAVHEPAGLAKAGSRFVFSGNDTAVVGVEPFAISSVGAALTNLADIDPAGDSSPDFLTEVGDRVFFFATDPTAGKELFVTDGTPAGTSLVLDINPGGGSSAGTNSPIAYNGYLFFGADDGVNGLELWRSDGTAAGTVMVKDIASGAGASDPGNFVVFKNILYFTADDGTHGLEVWRSDGTASGTYILKDIHTSSGSTPTLFAGGVGERVMYFTADNGSSGEELWSTDGTESGTALLADIDFGVGSSSPLHLTLVNDILFFSATRAAEGRELWKSDGTANGTVIVTDLNSGVGDGVDTSSSFFEYQGVLYFSGTTAISGFELFKVTPY